MSTSLRKRKKVSSACERCRKRKLGCDAERPCVHCVRAGAECVPRDWAPSSSEGPNTTCRYAQTPVYQAGSPILPESSIVDLSTLMIRGNTSSQDLHHDTSSLPGGKKLIDENATLAGPRHWSNLAGVELPSETILHILKHIKYQDTTFYWTWLLTVALGAHYAVFQDPDDQMNPQYQQLSQDLINVIETNFLRIIGCSTIESVQICVLLGSFIFYTRPTTSLGICGMGVKIAQVIGLHRESFWKETCQLAREEKRRTWWTLEVFDKYAAVAFGRPCIIDDSDCQVEMVSDIEFNGYTHVPAQPLILYHQHKFRLYRIMGAFLGRKRQSSNFESIDTIHQRMLQWRRDLPEILTLGGQHSSTDPDVVQPTEIHAMSLQLTYDNLQIILHRTAVFNNLSEINDTLPKRSTSLQQIFTAAMDTSQLSQHPRILDACRRTHADVHVGITMFTSGVVLCAICLSQPLTEMGSLAKTGVMHITRMCRQTKSGVYSGQLVSEQSLGIIDSLVEVILRQENDLITGRTSYPGLSTSQTMQNPAPSGQNSSSAGVVIASSSSSTALPGSSNTKGDRVLEPIQEVFRQHVSTQGNAEVPSANTSNDDKEGHLEAATTFNWDGDMSALVDQGFIDASQLWLWADNLDFDSFNNLHGQPQE